MKARIALSLITLLMAGIIAGAAPDQPFMRAAHADLQTAKGELQRAKPDKRGHRVKAASLVNRAIAQVNAGIAFDRRHNHANAVAADQPHMQAALAALESAKNNLERATSDKGGYRGRALDFVKDAISEVKKGIEAAH